MTVASPRNGPIDAAGHNDYLEHSTMAWNRTARRPPLATGLSLLAAPLWAATTACLVTFDGEKLREDWVCGDGTLDPREDCDDGNLSPADGCDASCRFELGWICAPGEPTVCVPACGDGLLRGDELCDGWNLGGATCQQLGFEEGTLTCEDDCRDVNVSSCSGYCGDGQAGGLEDCDGADLGGTSCPDLDFYDGVLGCDPATCRFDVSGCSGRCGDGVVSGTEVCDGALLNGHSCLNLGHYGGTLLCRSDCQDLDTSQCHVVPRILVNELQVWLECFLELVNASEVGVDLEGTVLRLAQEGPDGATIQEDLALPAYVLGPGSRVVVRDTLMGGGGPPQVQGAVIQFDVTFLLWRRPGALSVLTPLGAPTDFLRWGGTSIATPAGTSWTDSPAPLPSTLSNGRAVSLSRLPDGADGDIAGDFCVAPATEGAPNTAPCEILPARGAVLVTEVDLGAVNGIELYNPGSGPVSLSGWTLEGYRVGGALWSATLPDLTLAPASYLKIVGDLTAGAPTVENGVLHVTDPGWAPGEPGGLWISEPTVFQPVDWVQWGMGGVVVLNTYDWADTPQALVPPTGGSTLGRRTLGDTDSAADWCAQTGTLGGPNGGCL